MNHFDGIEVFVRVVQRGSFSGAARSLGMPITTVSGKVANLEKRLGITLIHRTTRKLSVTQAGRAFFDRCMRALEEIDAGEKEIATTKTEPEGLLSITAPIDIGNSLLPVMVREYLRTYSKMKVEIRLTNRYVDLISENVDLAIRVGELENSSIIARKFMEVETCLYVSNLYAKNHGLPKSPRDLANHFIIGFNAEEKLHFSNGKEKVKISIRPRIVVDDMEALKIFVLSGDGIAQLPSFMCEKEVLSGKLTKLFPSWALDVERVPISFVYPPQRFVSPKVQAFIEKAIQNKTLSN